MRTRSRKIGLPNTPITRLLGVLLVAFLAFAAMGSFESALAHPQDEFCELDPTLCRALAELDRAPSEATLLREAGGFPDPTGRSFVETVSLYIWLGITHIIPKGLDHILFVIALFLASTRWKPLLLQVSAFTIAHTITLGLAIMGVVYLPGEIVEPLIAASIAWVAIENIYFRDAQRWRPLIVFGFGLFHGLGFAGVLMDLGLPRNLEITTLISFNVGVEIGQLAVIALAFACVFWAMRRRWYRAAIVIPISLAIALIGAWWAVDRAFLQTGFLA